MANSKKNETPKDDFEEKKQLIIEERQGLQLLLIQGAENLIQDKWSDKYLDRQNEKVKLISGIEISLPEVQMIITGILKRHPPQFYLDYYIECYRLLGITDNDPKEYFKPKIIADITNETVYGRFDKDVLLTLQQINYYKGYCIRAHRHYHFFNDDGISRLQDILSENVKIMRECKTYYEYRKKLYELFKIPYQIQLFN